MTTDPEPLASPNTSDGEPPSPSLTTRAVRGFLWSALSFGGSRLIIFVVTLFLTRLLAPQDFGVVAAGLTLILFLEIALDLGLGAAVVYEQEEGLSDRVRTAYALNLTIAAGLTLVGVFSAPVVAQFFHTPEAESLFRVLFLYLILRGAGQVQIAVLQRDLRYRERTVIDITRALARAALSLALAAGGAGPWAIVLGMLAGEVVGLLLSWYYVPLRPVLRWDRTVVHTLLGFGVAVLGVKITSSLLSTGDDVVVGNRLGAEALGFYNIAVRLPELAIASVYWVFTGVAFPAYAKARLEGPEVFRETMLRVLRLVTLFGFCAGAGLAVVTPIAVPVLFSAQWEPAVEASVLTSVALGLASIGFASGDIFPAVGRPGILLRLTLSMTLVALVGFWFSAPYGIAAVAAVNLVFQVVFGLLRLRLANRLVGSTWRQVAGAMWPAVIGSAGVLAAALPVSLVVPHDVWGLIGTTAAGLLGGLVALVLGGRSALRDATDLLRSSRS
jgi:lipopolysaccharide exporter